MWLYIIVFAVSCLILFWSGSKLVEALMGVARYLGWREFVVAFVVMAIAGSVPNLLVGIDSALQGIPQLSLGDVIGGNVIDLTLAVALAVLIAKAPILAESRAIQTSVIFTSAVAVLPLILILDGTLGRGDGLILLFAFAFYIFWLFSKEERFRKTYDSQEERPVKEFKRFIKDLGIAIFSLVLLLAAAEGVVRSASFFASSFNLSLAVIGILIVGFGNALPEIYFSVASARRGQTGMILGNLMGSVVVAATLVLGIVALIHPIRIFDFSPFVIGRFFLIISAIFFLFFARTDRKITRREGLFLLAIYFIFVIVELFHQSL
jgi:cation:H+ antiporter